MDLERVESAFRALLSEKQVQAASQERMVKSKNHFTKLLSNKQKQRLFQIY